MFGITRDISAQARQQEALRLARQYADDIITSLPGVFAAGDVTTVPYKQIVIAAGEGAKAALSAFDHLIRH